MGLCAGLRPITGIRFELWRLIMRGKLRSKGRMIQGAPAGFVKQVLSENELALLIRWLPNFSRMVEDVLT